VVGRDYWSRNVQVAAIDSRIAIVALLSGGKFEIDLRQLMGKRIWITTTTLRTRESDYQIDLRNTFVKKIMPAFKDGSAKTIVDKVYDWKDVSEAHKRMEANLNAGKIICTVS
jgi:NADPH:quinone reductase-like Zn-dependent oxidoreductase